MKMSEIRDMTKEERINKLEALHEELLQLRIRRKTGNLSNPMRMRAIRHEIARILTVENQPLGSAAAKAAGSK